ncbi:MaoC-like protein [gamma proteobacterium HdN1]|nr:MaoC-like protein [gamma proteobacterium HdN1]
MSGTLELQQSPSTLSLYLRAVTAKKSGQAPAESRELTRIALRGVQAKMKSLNAYRKVCGFPLSGSLPVTYPFVLAFPLHMEMLVSDAFPFPLLGLVHVKNDITQYRAIGNQEVLDIECTLNGPRPANKGLEFDVHTRIQVAGKLVWESVSTMLRRLPETGEKKKDAGENKAAEAAPQSTAQWSIPENTGRKYAAASGDRNPIHLHAFTAKLFGFPRAIAHGMWTKAHCLAELDSVLPKAPFKVSVSFKLPVFLPSQVQFQHSEAKGRIEFQVKDSKGQKPHLAGVVEAL